MANRVVVLRSNYVVPGPVRPGTPEQLAKTVTFTHPSPPGQPDKGRVSTLKG